MEPLASSMLTTAAAGAAASGVITAVLTEILALLAVALLCGAVAEWLRQSALVGYIVAGILAGPSVFGIVSNQADIFHIAELGVAMLLFVIGLELSPRRIAAMGPLVLRSGICQIIGTLAITFLVARLLGFPNGPSLVVGAMITMSSTASVLRVLADNSELDSAYGRLALGILLLQDIAVIPLILIVSALAQAESARGIIVNLLWTVVAGILFVVLLVVVFQQVAVRMLSVRALRSNRDLPVLLALIIVLGSAWAAQQIGLSPALGCFVAGFVLGASPFAIQLRADIEPFKAVLMTLFFASVGMFGDVAWLFQHLVPVLTVVTLVVIGKTFLIGGIVHTCGGHPQVAIAAAVCLAQIGEFSFVLAMIGFSSDEASLLTFTQFSTLIWATIITMVCTPYLARFAPDAAMLLGRAISRLSGRSVQTVDSPTLDDSKPAAAILLIGFGPAGQRVAEELLSAGRRDVTVLDLNIDNIRVAQRYGLHGVAGDALQSDVLRHAGIDSAEYVVITIPSPTTTRRLIERLRLDAPSTLLFVRARYHVTRWQFVHIGAHVVVDEEDTVGHKLAEELLEALSKRADSV